MRDTSDSKAYSTKSSNALPKPASGGKKGAKDNQSQRRKKSNTSSNSRGKNSSSSRQDYDDLARKTTLVKEFIQ